MYQKPNDSAVYTADYSVSVVRQAPLAPIFTGTIEKTPSLPGTITFTAADFTSKYTKNDGAEPYSVAITGSNPSFGSLKIGSSNYSFGDAIPVSNLSELTFTATGAGTVSYVVNAYALGNTTNPIGSVTLSITVSAGSTAADVISFTKEMNETVTFLPPISTRSVKS
jgi:hypothetical protein